MYVVVRVTPDARKEQIEAQEVDEFLVSVREPAKGNRANARVRALLARHYRLPIGRVRIVSGHHSPKKIMSIDV